MSVTEKGGGPVLRLRGGAGPTLTFSKDRMRPEAPASGGLRPCGCGARPGRGTALPRLAGTPAPRSLARHCPAAGETRRISARLRGLLALQQDSRTAGQRWGRAGSGRAPHTVGVV